jgi:hypothetical protein
MLVQPKGRLSAWGARRAFKGLGGIIGSKLFDFEKTNPGNRKPGTTAIGPHISAAKIVMFV